jgi:hypothetical protein
MNELREHLRRADPLTREPMLSDDEATVLRERVLRFPPSATRRRLPGRRLTVLTSLAMLGIVASGLARVAMHRQTPDRSPARPSTVSRRDVTQSVKRVYFETPSGMRVVWVLEPESGEGTLP